MTGDEECDPLDAYMAANERELQALKHQSNSSAHPAVRKGELVGGEAFQEEVDQFTLGSTGPSLSMTAAGTAEKEEEDELKDIERMNPEDILA